MNRNQDLHAEAVRLKAGIRIAEVIGETLALNRNGRLLVGLCPFHSEKTPSFCVYPAHYHCFGCSAHGDVFAWLKQMRGMTFLCALQHLDAALERRTSIGRPMQCARNAGPGTSEYLDLARRIWSEGTDPYGSPVETYLHHRGVRLPDAPVIRFHPKCPRKGGARPAMLALMVDPQTGVPCGIHRTFLSPDGSSKALVETPKMMLGTAGVIRLAKPAGEALGLAEGIETALSAIQTMGWRPVWAAGSCGGIEKFPVLPGRRLTIFADDDPPGLKSARACAARWSAAGRETIIHIAPPGEDWNDAARRSGA